MASIGSDRRLCPAGPELANALTHGLGAAFSLAGLPVLLAGAGGRFGALVALGVYGLTLVLLYAASTAYHWLGDGRAKEVLQRCDHAAIYLLIAGTCTPFAALGIGGISGWGLGAGIWGAAGAGAANRLLGRRDQTMASILGYLALGWGGGAVLAPVFESLPRGGVALLVLGGLAYTLGIFFFRSPRRYAHAVWHLFVLTGSACHFIAILVYLRPVAA